MTVTVCAEGFLFFPIPTRRVKPLEANIAKLKSRIFNEYWPRRIAGQIKGGLGTLPAVRFKRRFASE